MKSILSKLIGKSSNSPAPLDLTWLNDLERVDDISAIENSTQKLKEYLAAESMNAADRLRAQLAIDKENRQRVNKISGQFVELQNLRPELENKMAESMYFYHRQIFVGYRSLIKHFLETSDNIIFTYNRLPLVLGRALQAAYSMARWRYYRQQSIADMTWSEIFEIFKVLEQESLLDLTVPLYHGEPDAHLAASFVQACMLDSLGSSGLNKQQVERAAMLLGKFIPWSKISRHYDEHKHLYYIDLSKDHGAKRIRLFEPTASCRYWDTDQLSAKINSAIEALDRDLPHDLDAIGSASELLEVLTQLRSEWSRDAYKRQRRSEERQKVIKNVIVTYGFREISDHLRSITQNLSGVPLQSEKNLDDRLLNHNMVGTVPTVLYEDLPEERWMISDESSSGYGVIVSEELPTVIKLGKLVGMVMEDQPRRLIVGSIKSVSRPANGENHVGIKIISKQAGWVQLSHTELKPEKPGVDKGNSVKLPGFPGMYLAVDPGFSSWPSLLLPRIEYIENGAYQLNHMNNTSRIQLGDLMESKDDWVRVKVNYLEE